MSFSSALSSISVRRPGRSFPCVDPQPHGKEEEEFQHTKIILAEDQFSGVTIDFGMLTNIGERESEGQLCSWRELADESLLFTFISHE